MDYDHRLRHVPNRNQIYSHNQGRQYPMSTLGNRHSRGQNGRNMQMGTNQKNDGKLIYEKRETLQKLCRCDPTNRIVPVNKESNQKKIRKDIANAVN